MWPLEELTFLWFLSFFSIYLKLNSVEEYSQLEKVLEKLCQEGKIYYSEKKKRYTPIENTNFKNNFDKGDK